MIYNTLFRFPVKAIKRKLPHAWDWKREQYGELIFVYTTRKKHKSNDALVLIWNAIDLQGIKIHEQDTFLAFDDSSQSSIEIESLQLVYNALAHAWLLGGLEFQNATMRFHIVLRIIREAEKLLGISQLFDDPANDMAAIGPLLMLETSNDVCRLAYLKPGIDDVSTPEIVSLKLIVTGNQVDRSTVNFAESALICKGKNAGITLLCRSEAGASAKNIVKVFDFPTYEWHFLLTGGADYSDNHWQYDLETGLPVNNRIVPLDDLFLGPLVVSAAAIEGPKRRDNGLSTFVVGMIMMNTLDNPNEKYRITPKRAILEQVGRLLCVDADGHIVQTYHGSVGLYMGLCRAKKRIMGVDLVEERWRLWNWQPLESAHFDQTILLAPNVTRACVISENEQGQDDIFWLIEEYADRIIISKRNANTLEEVVPSISLSDRHLLLPQSGYGRLDWHTEFDALVHDGVMLLLVVDNDDQPVLYRITNEDEA